MLHRKLNINLLGALVTMSSFWVSGWIVGIGYPVWGVVIPLAAFFTMWLLQKIKEV